MSGFDYDLFVIGAGSGGVRAARMSASHGARVAVAEEYRVGGTCVIRGCVPKKLMVYAARFSEEFDDAAGFGWSLGETSFDWATLIAAKDRELDRLEGIYSRNLGTSGVEIIRSRAVLRDAHTVHLVAEGRDVTARYILVATGGRPALDDRVAGIEHAITSNEVFHLERQPRRVAIVGGGYIAVEFAGIFAGLGTETTLVYRGPEILRGFDDDMRHALHDEMEKKGIRIVTGRVFTRIDRTVDGLEGELDDGSIIAADEIMFATGRVPNTVGLDLERVGVELGWNGHVVVDDYSRSSVPNIYAVGDVTHRVNLTPVAIREGAAFAETVFNDNPTRVDHSLIPTAVFSNPEIGTVGLTEAEAREKCRVLDVYRSSFRPMKHTLSGRDEKTVMKLLVDGESDKVVGCHILGPDAGEMIQLVGVALAMGATKADFDRTIAVHPTAAEELVTMRQRSERHVREDAAGTPPAPVMAMGHAPGHRAGHAAVTIREAHAADLPLLSRIALYAWQASVGPLLPQAWKRMRDERPFDPILAALGARVLVAELNGVPVGFAAADEPCLLSDIWVEPSAWRRGVGTALLSAMIERARSEGCDGLVADVVAGNVRARKFFAHHGFEVAREETRHDEVLALDVEMQVMRRAVG